jgi:hypothetical protein
MSQTTSGVSRRKDPDFVSHTGDSTVHFTEASISITESQISDLGSYLVQDDLDTHIAASNPHSVTAGQVGALTVVEFTGHTGAADPHSVYILADGSRAMTSTFDAGDQLISNVADAVSSKDAVNVQYLTGTLDDYLVASNNLSDITNTDSARSNLELKTLAAKNTIDSSSLLGSKVVTADKMNSESSTSGSALISVGAGLAAFNGEFSDKYHYHPIIYDDFTIFTQANNEWDETANGNGAAYQQGSISTIAQLSGDSGFGYVRLTCGNGSSSSNNVYWRPSSYARWSHLFRDAKNRFIWRAAITHTSAIGCSIGITSNEPTGLVTDASYSFVFDSTNGNIYFSYNDGAGTSDSIDTGIALNTNFQWFEIKVEPTGITALVDNSVVANIISDLPGDADAYMYPYGWIQGHGETWRNMYWDKFIYHGEASIWMDGIYEESNN